MAIYTKTYDEIRWFALSAIPSNSEIALVTSDMDSGWWYGRKRAYDFKFLNHAHFEYCLPLFGQNRTIKSGYKEIALHDPAQDTVSAKTPFGFIERPNISSTGLPKTFPHDSHSTIDERQYSRAIVPDEVDESDLIAFHQRFLDNGIEASNPLYPINYRKFNTDPIHANWDNYKNPWF